MRISKIVCDRCGAEIKEHPTRIFPEVVDRETGDIKVGTARASWDGSLMNYDFCDECTVEIIQFAKTKPENQIVMLREPTEKEMVDIVEAIKKEPVKLLSAENPTVEVLAPKKQGKPTVKELVLQGMDKKEIMRITECSPATVDQTKYNLKKAGLLPKELDSEEIALPVRAYDCNKVHDSCVYAGKGSLCDYIHETGKMRGCPVNECTKYEKKKKGGRK